MRDPLQLFIEQVIDQELEEDAVSLDRAQGSNLALSVIPSGSGKKIILYSPDALFAFVSKVPEEALDGDQPGWDYDDADNVLAGYIKIRPLQGCVSWTVEFSAAHKGFGPLMYDIAMSVIAPNGMTSDRSMVSPKAKGIWSYNFTKRQNDFNITSVKNSCPFSDPDDPSAKEPYLDFRYSLKHPLNTSEMQQRSTEALNKVKRMTGVDGNKVLASLAAAFFDSRYQNS